MGKTVVIFEHGINSMPSSWRDWTNRAVQWTITETGLHADSLEYFTTALTVWFRERAREQALAHKILWYVNRGWDVRLVGHSNGTREVLGALRLAGWPQVADVSLVCGACDANFERNGLNRALSSQRVKSVACYRAGRDWAMRLENTLLGKALFQMNESDKPLGLVGPQNIRPEARPFVRIVDGPPWSGRGHSDCWKPPAFEGTMRQLLEL